MRYCSHARSVLTAIGVILVSVTSVLAVPVGKPFVYKTVGDRELKVHFVFPADWKPEDKRPAILFFHAGSWIVGAPGQFNEHCKYLASRGMVAGQVEYRLVDRNNDEPPTVCIQDAKSALRWLRANVGKMGVDPERIAAGGGSAGGHLAAFLGIMDGLDDPKDDLKVSAKANAMVLFNPVFDNGPTGWGYKRVKDRYKEFSPFHNVQKGNPPAIVFVGEKDGLIPPKTVLAFQELMKKAGNRCEATVFEGEPHDFYNFGRKENKPYEVTVAAMDKFLSSLGWLTGPLAAQDVDALAGQRVIFLGDSITQSGRYVTLVTYYLEKLHPKKDFDVIGLGLASETLSGLSEDGHAGGKFPRPCLFERLGRLLEKAKPDIVFACYGINDGIYQPLDADRFAAFKKGVTRLIEQCKEAGVKEIYLVTPPIFDFTPRGNEFNYDAVMTAYAKWEAELKVPGMRVIDLHTAMRKARDARTEPFSRDHVHPGDDGHLLMARTILAALAVKVPDETVTDVQKDPLYKLVAEKRALRSAQWMKHIGYTREKTAKPEPLGTIEADAAKIQEKIDALRRAK